MGGMQGVSLAPAFAPAREGRRFQRLGAKLRWLRGGWVRRATAVVWMNALIGAVVVVAAVTVGLVPNGKTTSHDWAARGLTLFAVWLLSFLPGWLYVRFLGLRAGALWNEYVLNLHRLGWDDARYLPSPPKDSRYADASTSARGNGPRPDNIYRQKFDAYYGRQVSEKSGRGEDFTVNIETMFPVLLCTTTLAVAWSVMLWDPARLVSPSGPWTTLEFGFLGAYAFAISMLVRRFYQSDLRPSAYATVMLRIILVLLFVTALDQLFAVAADRTVAESHTEMVVAFVVGFFPLIGLQALQRATAKVLHVFVPQVAPEYPLDQLDGLNIWYEARLAEEGVEDMQNLTTMNLVDVILHTRAPVGRLVDWVDQAFLLIHLDSADRAELAAARGANDGQISHTGAGTRVGLRRIGVRSATDLLKALDPEAPGSRCADRPPLTPEALTAHGLDPDQIDLLVRVLRTERGLDPVWNWKAGGPALRTCKPA